MTDGDSGAEHCMFLKLSCLFCAGAQAARLTPMEIRAWIASNEKDHSRERRRQGWQNPAIEDFTFSVKGSHWLANFCSTQGWVMVRRQPRGEAQVIFLIHGTVIFSPE